MMSASFFCLSGAEHEAVQALLARYLQRRLQGAQFSTPPPPSVLFNANHQSRVHQQSQKFINSKKIHNEIPKEQDRREDYDDYEDDLHDIGDSAKSITRIHLLAGNVYYSIRHFVVSKYIPLSDHFNS